MNFALLVSVFAMHGMTFGYQVAQSMSVVVFSSALSAERRRLWANMCQKELYMLFDGQFHDPKCSLWCETMAAAFDLRQVSALGLVLVTTDRRALNQRQLF